jgi:hypothetical protein
MISSMLVLACLKHWYTSFVFFAPVPIVGAWLWLSNRRQRRGGGSGGPVSSA